MGRKLQGESSRVMSQDKENEKGRGVTMMKRLIKSVAVLSGSTSLLLIATLLPTANALELASVVEVNATLSEAAIEATAVALPVNDDEFSAMATGAIFSTEIAMASTATRQVELARTPQGAKRVAKSILIDEYGFNERQYSCLLQLWTKESNWNYKARNKSSGAHGIPQALPAAKMNVVSTDWRTNPVTQIRWGLRYISVRYETPCKALAKHKRSNWY